MLTARWTQPTLGQPRESRFWKEGRKERHTKESQMKSREHFPADVFALPARLEGVLGPPWPKRDPDIQWRGNKF